MKLRLFLVFVTMILAFGVGAVSVSAALSFGAGYYVNLCGSGTAATAYTCDPGCNPSSGTCTSNNNGVVKWICSGKWIQCFESESNWSNREEVGNPGCNKTVQISRFDKKCRNEDGSWDQSCNLQGYMVWYSGECSGVTNPTPTQNTTPLPTFRVSPTLRPSATPIPTATPRPTNVPQPSPTPASKFTTLTVSPTVTPTRIPTPSAAMVCGKSCSSDSNCQAGFACVGGECRNPACPSDSGCFCGNIEGVATGSGMTKTPETGGEMLIFMAGVVGVGVVGWKMKKMAVKIW